MTSSKQRRRLLSKLDYDQDAAGADLVSLHTLGPTLSRDDQERSIYVTKSEKLAKWVAAERSTVLLVNGNGRGIQRRSALGFVCARLSFALEQIRAPGGSKVERPDVVPLYFFCGQHASGDQSWETPAGVLNSLIVQLLTRCRDLDLTKTLKLGKFDNEDVQEVFHYFESAIAKVPADTTVLCVIDGLSFYLDDSEVSDEAERLVRRLMRLVRAKSRKRPCTFKLLLTASNQLHASEVEELGEGEILNVPSVLPFTGGFTAMKWNLGVGQQLESLAESE